MRKELEDRLVLLAVNIDILCKGLKKSYLAQHLLGQIIRSSTSAALNYGEAQAAESKKDFIHKVSVVLKELRETQICLKLLSGSVNNDQQDFIEKWMNDCDQLIAIYHKTIMTAKSK